MSQENVPQGRTAKLSEVDVLREASGLLDLPDLDYTYGCVLTTPAAPELSAEAWAREVFEGAAPPLRNAIIFGWRFGLGLRLGPMTTPTHVLGWEIARRTTDGVLLGVRSPLLDARLIVRARADIVLHLTLIRYRLKITGVLWTVAARIHETVIPYLLAASARRHRSPALLQHDPTD